MYPSPLDLKIVIKNFLNQGRSPRSDSEEFRVTVRVSDPGMLRLHLLRHKLVGGGEACAGKMAEPPK